jgi:hypothetical protein
MPAPFQPQTLNPTCFFASEQLFDAATVADKKHAAAWHGWGMLEKKQGNLLRARDLWKKVLRARRSVLCHSSVGSPGALCAGRPIVRVK